MKYSTGRRFNLRIYLRIIFTLLNCFGLTGISYIHEEAIFERSEVKHRIASYVYTFTRYFSGYVICKFIFFSLLHYMRMTTYDTVRSVEAQEEVISELCSYTHIAAAFVYSSNYYRLEGNLPALLNEGLRIFKKLKSRTGPDLFLSWQMVKVLIIKLVILMFILKYVFLFTFLIVIAYQHFEFHYCLFPILKGLMSFSYIFVQLTLLCYYEKMNDYLHTFGLVLERNELTDCLREFMSISSRIQSLQRRINSFSSSVFFCTYIGLVHDIQFVYLTLKTIFYSKYFSSYTHSWLNLNFRYFPACLFYIFDMFIIALLSDTLIEANASFTTIVDKLSECSPSLRGDVEMMLISDKIRGVGLQAFGNIRVNHQFAFDFAVNIVLFVVISFLQFFAAEEVYSKHYRKAIVVRDYVHNV